MERQLPRLSSHLVRRYKVYKDPKYVKNPITGEITSIHVKINDSNDCFVPLDPANTDYKNIMKLVEEGELVIQPVDDEES